VQIRNTTQEIARKNARRYGLRRTIGPSPMMDGSWIIQTHLGRWIDPDRPNLDQTVASTWFRNEPDWFRWTGLVHTPLKGQKAGPRPLLTSPSLSSLKTRVRSSHLSLEFRRLLRRARLCRYGGSPVAPPYLRLFLKQNTPLCSSWPPLYDSDTDFSKLSMDSHRSTLASTT
jgi:hypothetical protein